MTSKVLSIQVGKPETYRHEDFPDDEDLQWTSGIFKSSIAGQIFVGKENLDGDGQADLRFHGGPDRAVLVFSQLNYPHWEAELGRELPGGAFGENLTVDSVTEDDVCLGDRWEVADVLLEVSQPRLPCFKLARRLNSEGLNAKVMRAMTGGWYCRVLREGPIAPGDLMTLIERPHPEWPIRRAFRENIFGKDNDQVLEELIALPALSTLWKESIQTRIEKRST